MFPRPFYFAQWVDHFVASHHNNNPSGLGWEITTPSTPNRRQNLRHHFDLWLRSLPAFAWQSHAHLARVHIPPADDEHSVNFGFCGFGADFVRAQFAVNLLRVSHELLIAVERQHADLFGREPEREVAGVIFDQEADETFVRAERC